jgi:hypothetical protein
MTGNSKESEVHTSMVRHEEPKTVRHGRKHLGQVIALKNEDVMLSELSLFD